MFWVKKTNSLPWYFICITSPEFFPSQKKIVKQKILFFLPTADDIWRAVKAFFGQLCRLFFFFSFRTQNIKILDKKTNTRFKWFLTWIFIYSCWRKSKKRGKLKKAKNQTAKLRGPSVRKK